MRQHEREELIQNMEDHYVYIKSIAEYYWIEQQRYYKPKEVESNLMCTKEDLYKLRKSWTIPSFDGICYREWWKAKCLNLYDESTKLLPDWKAMIHPQIEQLIHNICWHKEENIEYLYQIILYKYTHINDFTIPALVLYGVWWSGKGTFMSLMWTIFWDDNILANLWQKDISWSFDTYTGKKLVVEFAEITTNNTGADYRVLNKLKNMIWAEKITVNEKNLKQYQTDNIAWFIISSNSNKPLQLDDKDKWNRRFTIIRSTTPLQNGKEINDIVKNKKIVAEFLAWLFEKYPEIPKMDKILALENKDKQELEERAQSEANEFWDWFEEEYPCKWWKITLNDMNAFIDSFCGVFGIDSLNFKKYFWNHSKYPKKKIRVWANTHYWVYLPEKTWENNRTLELSDVEKVF